MPYTTQIDLISQTQLCERLRHLTLFSSHLLFVSGAHGAGKSTILSDYVESDFNQHSIAIDAKKEFGETAIRTTILKNITFDGYFNSQLQLPAGFLELDERLENECTVCIDNAQHLSSSFVMELAQLIELSLQNKISITINVILFANSDWVSKTMANFTESTTNILELEVEELDSQAAVQFIEAQFRQANYKPQFENKDAIYKQIENCKGNPDLLIKCAQAMMNGEVFNPNKSKKSAFSFSMTPVQSYSLAGFIAILLLFGGGSSYLYDTYQAELAESERKAALALIPAEVQPNSLENAQAVLDQSAAEKQAVSTTVVEPVIVEEPPLLASNWDDELPPTLAETVTLTQKANDSESDKKRIVIADEEVKEIIEIIASAPTVDMKGSDLTPAEKANQRGKAWIMEQPAKNYTFQIAGLSRPEQVQVYLDEHGLSGKVQTYQTQRNNKPWYVVLYGSYSSVEKANVAKDKLPDAVKKDQPWMKTFVQIQREL